MENKNLKKNILKLILFILILLIFIFFSKLYKSKKNNISIKIIEYNTIEDKNDLLKIFDDNFYWLICGMERKDYNFEQTFIKKIYKTDNEEKELKILVAKENNKVYGFVTYYFYNDEIGRIHLLAVDKEKRGINLGEKLIRNGIEDMFKNENIKKIFIMVRKENTKAKNLYNKVGFYEIKNDDDPNVFILLLDKDKYFEIKSNLSDN